MSITIKMSIKNPNIIHKVYLKADTYPYDDKKHHRYKCISAVIPTKSKSTTDWNKVTCKNCLRLAPRSHLKLQNGETVDCDQRTKNELKQAIKNKNSEEIVKGTIKLFMSSKKMKSKLSKDFKEFVNKWRDENGISRKSNEI